MLVDKLSWEYLKSSCPVISVRGPVQLRVRTHVTEFIGDMEAWVRATVPSHLLGDPNRPVFQSLLSLDTPVPTAEPVEVQYIQHTSGEGGVALVRRGDDLLLLNADFKAKELKNRLSKHIFWPEQEKEAYMSANPKSPWPPEQPTARKPTGVSAALTCMEPAEKRDRSLALEANYVVLGYEDGTLALHKFVERRRTLFQDESNEYGGGNDLKVSRGDGEKKRRRPGRDMTLAEVKYMSSYRPGEEYGHSEAISAMKIFRAYGLLWLVTGGWDKRIVIFKFAPDSETPFRKHRFLDGHADAISGIQAFSIGSSTAIISTSLDSTVSIWHDYQKDGDTELKPEVQAHALGKITCSRVVSVGTKQYLVCGGQAPREGQEAMGGQVLVYDLNTGSLVQGDPKENPWFTASEVTCVEACPADPHQKSFDIITGHRDGTAYRWKAKSMKDAPQVPAEDAPRGRGRTARKQSEEVRSRAMIELENFKVLLLLLLLLIQPHRFLLSLLFVFLEF